MVRAMSESRAVDDEGEFPTLGDLLDFSGENKTHTVIKAAYRTAISSSPKGPGADPEAKLEWRDHLSPGLNQYSLYFNGRSVGMVQKYGFDNQWQVHFQGDFSKVDTEQEARQALEASARSWLRLPESRG
jgi:hypothetical protein